MKRRVAAVVTLATLAAGCGSTVQQRGSITTPGGLGSSGLAPGGDLGTAAGPQAGPGAQSTTGAQGGGSGPRAAAGGTAAGGGTSAPSSGSSTTGGSGGRPTGALLTTPIKVGIVTTRSTSAASGGFGFKGVDNGDELSVVKAAIASINSHGGIGGRRLDRVSFEVDPSRDAGKSTDTLAGEMCATFTSDNHVEVVLYRSFFPELAACLAKKGVPYVVSAASQAPTEAQLRQLPQIRRARTVHRSKGPCLRSRPGCARVLPRQQWPRAGNRGSSGDQAGRQRGVAA